MKFDEYEALVKHLFAALVEQIDGLPADAVGYGRRNRHTGASGFKHQIDVSIRTVAELHLIECKYWKRQVTPGALLCLAARAHDIRVANPGCAVKSALATTKGQSAGVNKLAEFFKVTLQRVGSPEEFALKYRDQIHLSVPAESVYVIDTVKADLVPAIQDRPIGET